MRVELHDRAEHGPRLEQALPALASFATRGSEIVTSDVSSVSGHGRDPPRQPDSALDRRVEAPDQAVVHGVTMWSPTRLAIKP